MAYKDKEKENQYNAAYKKENYDRINILAKKGFKSEVKQAADHVGENISMYIVEAVRMRMQSEGISPDPDTAD